MKLSITTNFGQVQKQLDALQRGMQKAAARTINAVAAEAEVVMAREMQKKLGVPAATIAKVLHIDRARTKGPRLSLRATLAVRSRSTALLQRGPTAPFAVGPTAPFAVGPKLNRRIVQSRQRANDLLARSRRAGSRRSMPGAVRGRRPIAGLLNMAGLRVVPVKALLSTAVAEQFNDRRIKRRTLAAIQSRLPMIFERKMRKYVDRFNSGAAPSRRATPGLGSFLQKFFARVG